MKYKTLYSVQKALGWMRMRLEPVLVEEQWKSTDILFGGERNEVETL
jgi:hypothetical protein